MSIKCLIIIDSLLLVTNSLQFVARLNNLFGNKGVMKGELSLPPWWTRLVEISKMGVGNRLFLEITVNTLYY